MPAAVQRNAPPTKVEESSTRALENRHKVVAGTSSFRSRAQVRPHQVRLVQIHLAEVRAAEVRLVEVRTDIGVLVTPFVPGRHALLEQCERASRSPWKRP
jgi:hypothetical protein